MLPGVYDFSGEVARLLSGPSMTVEALVQAGLLIRRARANGKTEEEALAEAAASIPALESVRALANTRAGKVAVWVLLFLAEKGLDYALDQVMKPDTVSSPPVEATVRKLVDEEFAKREAAAALRAAILEPSGPVGLKLSRELRRN